MRWQAVIAFGVGVERARVYMCVWGEGGRRGKVDPANVVRGMRAKAGAPTQSPTYPTTRDSQHRGTSATGTSLIH